jgi:hypothetical protein
MARARPPPRGGGAGQERDAGHIHELPLEVRAQAIAVFFAIAQLFGAFGSHWYGHLIGTGHDRNTLFLGYLVGAIAMIVGGLAAIFFGVNAEGKALEDVATPLSVIAKPAQTIFRSGDPGPVQGT